MEDLRFFGHILLILFTGKLNAAYPENIGASMQYVEQNCSVDLRNIIQSVFLYVCVPDFLSLSGCFVVQKRWVIR